MSNPIDKYKTIVPNVYQFKNKTELMETMSLLDENLTEEEINKSVEFILFNKHKFGLVYHCCENYTNTPFFKIINGVESIMKKTPIEETVDKVIDNYSENEISHMLSNCRKVSNKLSNCQTLEEIRENTDLDTSHGLCKMLTEHSSKSNRVYSWVLIETCQSSWEEYTGKYYEPVPNISDCGNWEGENLLLRKSLLNHVIYCLETALEIYPSVLTKEEILNLKEGKGLIDVYQPEEEPKYFYEGLKRGALTALFVFLITCTIISFLN